MPVSSSIHTEINTLCDLKKKLFLGLQRWNITFSNSKTIGLIPPPALPSPPYLATLCQVCDIINSQSHYSCSFLFIIQAKEMSPVLTNLSPLELFAAQ